ncbi:MAG: type II toxin-antitoxin system VapC family toxin [Candidatus Woesearchaeota archaeon]
MYCMDTNILIDLLRGKKEIVEKTKKLKDYYIDISITEITLFELYKGVFLTNNPNEIIQKIEDLIKNIEILKTNKQAYLIFGKTYSELRKKGNLIEDFDLIIASICIANNKTLITKNKAHFEKISSLKLEIW